MVKQITIDNPTAPNLFALDDALITTSTTAVDFVSDDLEKLAVELISNNELRVKSGVFCIGGHYGYVPSGTFETCYISPGNMGFKRKDLIVARYTRVGNLDYIGIQHYTGVPTKGTPVAPTPTVSDLNTNGKIREIALHVVELNDMDIVNVESVFPLKTKREEIDALFSTSYFTTDVGTEIQYHAKLETYGIITETIKIAKTFNYTFNTGGVWMATQFFYAYAPIDITFTASDIIAIPSITNAAIIKAQIRKVEIIEFGGTKYIKIEVAPYMFANGGTISADISIHVRYTKVKL